MSALFVVNTRKLCLFTNSAKESMVPLGSFERTRGSQGSFGKCVITDGHSQRHAESVMHYKYGFGAPVDEKLMYYSNFPTDTFP